MSLTALPPVSLDDLVSSLFACDVTMRRTIADRVGISLVQLSDILQGHVDPPAQLVHVLLRTLPQDAQIV